MFSVRPGLYLTAQFLLLLPQAVVQAFQLEIMQLAPGNAVVLLPFLNEDVVYQRRVICMTAAVTGIPYASFCIQHNSQGDLLFLITFPGKARENCCRSPLLLGRWKFPERNELLLYGIDQRMADGIVLGSQEQISLYQVFTVGIWQQLFYECVCFQAFIYACCRV